MALQDAPSAAESGSAHNAYVRLRMEWMHCLFESKNASMIFLDCETVTRSSLLSLYLRVPPPSRDARYRPHLLKMAVNGRRWEKGVGRKTLALVGQEVRS